MSALQRARRYHLHLHVIPRYLRDVDDPRGGISHVIPWRGNYAADQQRANPSIVSPPHSDAIVTGECDPLLPHLLAHIDLAEQVDIAVAFTSDPGYSLVESHLQDLLNQEGRLR